MFGNNKTQYQRLIRDLDSRAVDNQEWLEMAQEEVQRRANQGDNTLDELIGRLSRTDDAHYQLGIDAFLHCMADTGNKRRAIHEARVAAGLESAKKSSGKGFDLSRLFESRRS